MILSIETATATASLALVTPAGQVVAECAFPPQPSQASSFFALLEGMLQSCQMTVQDIEKIAVCHGPGSYTGIRLGLAAAQGVALARNLPLYPVSVLQAIACQNGSYPMIATCGDGAGGFVQQTFDRNGAALSEITPIPHPVAVPVLPLAGAVGQVVAAGWAEPAAAIVPLYLRPSYAERALQASQG